MTNESAKPFHINANPGDLNNRYIFLCGSDERANFIAQSFSSLIIQESRRGHHLYLGDLISEQTPPISVAAISTGMGCPSEDIILNELYQMGGRHFLRVGTAGSLQPQQIKTGDIVIPTAAVRDEDTSACYIMPEYPAVASIEMVNAIQEAVTRLQLTAHAYTGIIHTKCSFYARELNTSFLSNSYMETLHKAGVLATEMECSHLFILSSLYDHATEKNFHQSNIMAGAILAIVGDDQPFHASPAERDLAVKRAIAVGFETVKILAAKRLL